MCRIFADVNKQPYRLSFTRPVFRGPLLPGLTFEFIQVSNFFYRLQYIKNSSRDSHNEVAVGKSLLRLASQHCCISRPRCLRYMPGRMRNGSDGLLFSSRVHLGGHSGSISTSFHHRLQRCIRNMSSGLRCGVINTDTLRFVRYEFEMLSNSPRGMRN